MKNCLFVLATVLTLLVSVPVYAQDTIGIDNLSVCSTTAIVVPVNFYNDSTALDSIGFHLAFDETMLAFDSITTSDISTGWTFSGTAAGGDLTVTGSGSAIPVFTDDILCFINLTCINCSHGSSSAFGFSLLSDDLTGFTATDGSLTWYDGCGIAVSNSSGCIDPVDFTVSLSSTSTVDHFQFQLDYDNSMLQFQSGSASDLTSDWVLVTAYEPTGSPGSVIVVASTNYGGTAISAGSNGNLILLNFTITCETCEENDISTMTFVDLQHDLTGYTATDGQFTYQCGSPVPPQLVLGNSLGYTGETIQIPVTFINSPNDVDAFGFEVTYCQSMLAFLSCDQGELTADFEDGNFGANVTAPGIITVGGFDYENQPIPAGSSGSVAYLNFQVTCSSCTIGDTCDMHLQNLEDDILNWETDDGVYTYFLTILPATGVPGVIVLLCILTGIIFFRHRKNTQQEGLK